MSGIGVFRSKHRYDQHIACNEYYTTTDVIYPELPHYRQHYHGAHVHLPADDPRQSFFWDYFSRKFSQYKLRRLTACHFDRDATTSQVTELTSRGLATYRIPGNGGIGSYAADEYWWLADIIITNPPYSNKGLWLDLLVATGTDYILLVPPTLAAHSSSYELFRRGAHGGVNHQNCPLANATNTRKAAAFWLTSLEPDVPRKTYTETDEWQVTDDGLPRSLTYDTIPRNASRWHMPLTFFRLYDPSRYQYIGPSCPTLRGKSLFQQVLMTRRK